MPTTGRLNSGDLAIFARFPCLTVALFHALVCPTLSRKTAEAKIADLKKEGLIEAHPLTGNKVFYSLTKKGADALGIPWRRKPLGPHAVMRHIVVAAYVAMTNVRILPQEETEERFSEVFFGEPLWPQGIPSTLCFVEASGEAHVFSCLIVDYGKAVRRLHKALEKHFRRLEGYAVTRGLLASGNYRLVVLTGHEPKAAKIRRLKLPYPVTVTVVPELGDLLRG